MCRAKRCRMMISSNLCFENPETHLAWTSGYLNSWNASEVYFVGVSAHRWICQNHPTDMGGFWASHSIEAECFVVKHNGTGDWIHSFYIWRMLHDFWRPCYFTSNFEPVDWWGLVNNYSDKQIPPYAIQHAALAASNVDWHGWYGWQRRSNEHILTNVTTKSRDIVSSFEVWRCDRGWQCLEAAQRSGPLLSADSIGNWHLYYHYSVIGICHHCH